MLKVVRLKVWNRHHFTNLDALQGSWELQANGTMIEHGNLDISLDPLEKTTV